MNTPCRVLFALATVVEPKFTRMLLFGANLSPVTVTRVPEGPEEGEMLMEAANTTLRTKLALSVSGPLEPNTNTG